VRAAWGSNADRTIISLREDGPQTEAELVDRIGITQNAMAGLLARLRASLPRLPKRIYICGWRSTGAAGTKRHLRPVYAAGNLPDVARPVAVLPSMSRAQRRSIRDARAAAGITR